MFLKPFTMAEILEIRKFSKMVQSSNHTKLQIGIRQTEERINQLYFGILNNKKWTQLQFTKLDIKEGIKRQAQLKNGLFSEVN